MYRASDGRHVYLHFMCLRMLKDQQSSRPLPFHIAAPIVSLETITQSSKTRQCFRPTANVPLHTTFEVALVDMSCLVSAAILEKYSEKFTAEHRQQKSAGGKVGLDLETKWCAHKEKYGLFCLADGIAQPTAKPTLTRTTDLASDVTTASEHGPSDTSLETRQRATKRDVECDPPVVPIVVVPSSSTSPSSCAWVTRATQAVNMGKHNQPVPEAQRVVAVKLNRVVDSEDEAVETLRMEREEAFNSAFREVRGSSNRGGGKKKKGGRAPTNVVSLTGGGRNYGEEKKK